MRLRVISAADTDVIEAASFEERKKSGRGAQFLDDFDEATKRILAGPGACPTFQTDALTVPCNTRFVPLKHFDYLVIFQEHTDECTLAAVIHAHRDLSVLVGRL